VFILDPGWNTNLKYVYGPCVSAIKPYEGFGDVDHIIKELMNL
jgi:hypothetical protein